MTRRLSLLAALATFVAGLGLFASPANAVLYGGFGDWRTVSAGATQTCAIRATGQLYCWNTDGSGSAFYPINSARDWRSVSIGANHGCAIRSTGLLYCWGSDTFGQIGDGSTVGNGIRRVGTATNWKAVSAGGTHTCGVRSDGRLYCWGNDESGQIGNGSAGSPNSPAQITSSRTWSGVVTGASHTCAIRAGGILYCWGENDNGQIGDGSTDDRTEPTRITSAGDWKGVSAGNQHTCAVRGKLYCWGADGSGQIGNGSAGASRVPTQVTSAKDWKGVTAGGEHNCAVRGSGLLYCWGANAARQAVETSGTSSFNYPQKIAGNSDWRIHEAGNQHTCAIRTNGWLYCWGNQVRPSNGTAAGSANPSSVLDLRRWKLTIPYDGSDSNTAADEIKWPAMGTYRNLNWFHTTTDNKAVVFRSPINGIKTGGSVFARSELREIKQSDGSSTTNCDWSNQSGTHTMVVTQRVTHLPAKVPNIVVGQIHDPRDEVVMARVNGSTIIAELSTPKAGFPDGEKTQTVLKNGYSLGTTFTIKIVAYPPSSGNPGGVTVVYNEGKSDQKVASFPGRVATNASPDKTSGDGWYFKAGMYLQSNTAKGESPNEFGENIISALSINHSNNVCG